MADAVADACEELGIAQALLVGHSMGGYAALAFARKYPQCTAGLCLLHSTPNADSPEKRVARAAEIDLIASGKRDKVIRDALPKLFAPQNLKRMQPRIDELACALQVSNEGIIACIKGMQERSDMNDFLKEFAKPLLLVFGRGDMYIAAETAQTMIDKFPQAQTVWVENSGHCGFLEEPEKALQTLLEFAGKVFG